jgi:hypothetical protein
MYGKLKVFVAVRFGSRTRFITIYTARCEREEADKLVSEFKRENPEFEECVASITWQADCEFL